MKLQFESFSDFLAMGGHGPYVWASYFIVLAALLYFGFLPNFKYKQFIREQKRLQAQQQRIAEQKAKLKSTKEVG